ncbi:pectinesterase [Chryseobacterium bernardetii]|uniref:Pectinesterase n=3 Tax=Chryseobacterium TaxID=59732 RepID=A0A543EJD4_9FLAO|nr:MULTISPECIES: pectinesterase family protein [Chryseobacterium]MDR6370141.1 pectinesterase [Chryseobacterium vietnamense]MDR6440616.1 pectinesterase [Chryseobacterium bernardetii]MDR6458174.1 pectinesterase [Chryseobacterium vietnamense]TQM21701.1 pectinesterase [Chryseobacterium aquifrigidense]
MRHSILFKNCTLFSAFLITVFSLLSFRTREKTLLVSKDGKGDFTTIQQAIDAVENNSYLRTKIVIKAGIYKEKIVIPESKGPLFLEGENSEKTIITYDDFASKKNADGKEIGTTGSSTLFIYSDDFSAKNISFENSSGRVGQAVAVLTSGDRIAFENCRFLGNQDTLYLKGVQDLQDKTKPSRNYFKNCYIEGTTDYIFGAGTAVFENCIIYSKETASYITAASTPLENKFGFVFINSKIIGNAKEHSVYLGRPWRPFAKTVYIDCELNSTIKPEGWHNWSKPDAEKTTFYAESHSKGTGANPMQRVSWSHQLTQQERKKYTAGNILKGMDSWNAKKSLK